MKPLPAHSTARGIHLAVLVLVSCACLIGVLGVINLNDALSGFSADAASLLTMCPHRSLTGELCPLCGTITASSLALWGNIQASLETNPLAIGLFPFALSQLIYRIFRVIKPKLKLGEELLISGSGVLFLVIVLIVF